MILDKNNNQEHELYVKALRSLDTHNKPSDHTKVAETPEERALMTETKQAIASSSFGFSNIDDGRWTMIFGEDSSIS